jgi:hypothetical protein
MYVYVNKDIYSVVIMEGGHDESHIGDNIEFNMFLNSLKSLLERYDKENHNDLTKLNVYSKKCPPIFIDKCNDLITQLNKSHINTNDLMQKTKQLLYRYCPHEWETDTFDCGFDKHITITYCTHCECEYKKS